MESTRKPAGRPYMLTEEAMRSLLVDVEHCRDALEFRPDLVQRLKWFIADHRSCEETLESHRQHIASRQADEFVEA